MTMFAKWRMKHYKKFDIVHFSVSLLAVLFIWDFQCLNGYKLALELQIYNAFLIVAKVAVTGWLLYSLLNLIREILKKELHRSQLNRLTVERDTLMKVTLLCMCAVLSLNGQADQQRYSVKLASSFDTCKVVGLDGLTVQATPRIAEKFNKELTGAINKLPTGLMKEFERDGWQIVLYSADSVSATESLSRLTNTARPLLNLDSIRGMTVVSGKKVILLTDYLTTDEEFERVFLHELGHYFELTFKPSDWGKQCSDLYGMEKWVGYNDSEIFAEIFSNLCYDERSLYTDREEPAYLVVKKLIASFNY